jgi:hypothetical protein
MFATLLGGLPRPLVPHDVDEGVLVDAAIAAQVGAGLEPVTDGGWWDDRPLVDAWLETSRRTDRIVKQSVVGPLSAASPGPEAALALNATVRALADAGCPFIEIHEPNLATIGDDPAGWARVRELHAVLTEGVMGTHLSLAVTGGAIHPAGFEAVLAAPFASYALDLIAGPQNWRFVRAVPGDRGIICGAMPTAAATDEGPETLLWAAAYAASSDGRGRDRVGLATASSLADLPWDVAVRKLRRLGDAAELAGRPSNELRAGLDPRSIDARTAALGHGAPRRRRGP